jgi:transposase-like protein
MRLIPRSLQDNITSALLHSQKSYGQIASKLGCNKATISRLAKKINHDKENFQGSKSKKFTATDEKAIISQINTEKAENAIEVAKNLNNIISNPVSIQTIWNVLKKCNMKAVVKKKKPLLSIRHQKQRLDFALKYKEWTVKDWKRVIWSDETKINSFESDGRKWMWKQKGQSVKRIVIEDCDFIAVGKHQWCY